MAQHKQIAFIPQGKSSYNALSGINAQIAQALDQLGVQPVVLDLLDRERMPAFFEETLRTYGVENVLCAFCVSGIGLQLGEKSPAGNVWARFRIPAINWLLDHPAHMPVRNSHDAVTTINAYPNHNFIDFQRQYIRSERLISFLPFAPFTSNTPPQQRKINAGETPLILFPKSLHNPADREAIWEMYPPLIRQIIWDSISHYWDSTDRVGPVHESVILAAEGQNTYIENNIKLLTVLISEVDYYIRSRKSDIMVREMLNLPVRIYAPNIEYVVKDYDPAAIKATVVPPIDYDELEKLYHEALAVISVNPNVTDGAHDRVFSCLGSGTLPITDANPWFENNYPELMPYTFNFTDRSLTESINRVLQDPQQAADLAWSASEKALKGPSFVDTVKMALNLAAAQRFSNALVQI